MFRRLLKDRSGATAVEYGALLVAIALALVVGFNSVSGGINFLFADNNSRLRQALSGDQSGD